MVHVLSLSLVLSVSAYAPLQAGSAPLAPELEQRVRQLGSELRCAVCQGLSIADSPSSMARAQLDKVRELVAAGKTDAEVRAYFVERYGEWVLLEPKAEGFNWLVWLAPGVLLLIGLFVIRRQVRGGPPQSPGSAEAPSNDAPSDPYLAAVRSELER